MNLPKVIKSIQVPHLNRFNVGPLIWTIQFIQLDDRMVAVEFWYYDNGTLYTVRQRELRKEDDVLLAA
jgi:hypothetical protein